MSSLKSDYRHISNMPKDMSVKDDVKFGLLALNKWSEQSGGVETAGVMYVNPLGEVSFVDLVKGTEDMVKIYIRDVSNYSLEEAKRFIKEFKFKEKTFILLPEHYQEDDNLPNNHIVKRGKKVTGSVHVHPSGNPPSAGDFAQMLYSQDTLKGIIAGEELYLFIRTKESPQLELSVTDDRSNNMWDYQKEMDLEIEGLRMKNLTEQDARMQILIKHAQLNNLTLYKGVISDNTFKRII